jgi:hypothetical protein
LGHRGVVQQKAGKRFFFEKNAPRPGKQKTFALAGAGTVRVKTLSNLEVFCFPGRGAFFSKKKRFLLASATSAAHEHNLSFASSKAG